MSVPGSLYSMSPAAYQAKSRSPPIPMGASAPSFGPLMNPSSETASPVRTFPMVDLHPIGLREVRGLEAVPTGIRDQSSGLPPLTR